MTKDANDQPAEEARSGRVPSAGDSVPVELGAQPHQHVDVFANLEALQALQFKNFLETLSCGHD